MKEYIPAIPAPIPGTVEISWLIVRATLEIHPGVSLAAIKRKTRLIYRAFRYRKLLKDFYVRVSSPEFNGIISVTSDIVLMIEGPYINKAWNVAQRLDRIANHYELLVSLSTKLLAVDRTNPLTLANLSMISNGSRIVIDRAPWFKREGELVLNLFKGELRVASIAFIFGIHDGAPTIFIGAVQGIHSGVSTEESLLVYKNLTKDFEGLRPRSLLLDILKTIGNTLGIRKILAVADENRQHRHEYFGVVEASKLATNYNTIWIEHGGSQSVVPGFYEIPLQIVRREPDEIPSRKRAMYRRRYEILDGIEREIANSVS